ncbi:MAG: KH domain-containing protein [Candidatus Uhrbacteria bacterium]
MFFTVTNETTVATYPDQEFIDYVVRALVNKPDKVESRRTVDEMGVLITLKVDPEDMGYVIGRQGQTARSLRTLLKIVGAKNNARVNLKIDEPEGSTHVRRPQPEAPKEETGTNEKGTGDVDPIDLEI